MNLPYDGLKITLRRLDAESTQVNIGFMQDGEVALTMTEVIMYTEDGSPSVLNLAPVRGELLLREPDSANELLHIAKSMENNSVGVATVAPTALPD